MNQSSTSSATSPGRNFTGVIRPPRSHDYPRLADLAGQLSYPSTAEEIERRLAVMAGSRDHAVFVAETQAGEIAGWIAVFISRGLEINPRGEISGLIVDERFRSQAVGKHLLTRAEEWTREQGCEIVGLRSNVIRDRAHAFYLREGYEHTKTQKTFRKNLVRKS
jgi:ribosomal protein S18 acetylase RimI-like enzyme